VGVGDGGCNWGERRRWRQKEQTASASRTAGAAAGGVASTGAGDVVRGRSSHWLSILVD
jgi:hypothetical protein